MVGLYIMLSDVILQEKFSEVNIILIHFIDMETESQKRYITQGQLTKQEEMIEFKC